MHQCLQQRWRYLLYSSSHPPHVKNSLPCPTNRSTVSITNGWDGKHWLHSIHTHISPSVCCLSLHVGSSESRKTVEQKKLSFKSAYLISMVSTSAFHSTDLFLFSRHGGKRAWSSTNKSLPVYAPPLISQIYNIFVTASKCRENNRHSAQWPPRFLWPFSFRGNFTLKECQERR